MSHLAEIPVWATIVISLLVILGTGLTLLGTLGLVLLTSFYDRIHAPTLGSSWGTAATMLGSALMFSLTGGRPVLHEVIIAMLIMTTTPVTLMILARAALARGDVTERAGRPAALTTAVPGDDPAEAAPHQG